MSVALTGLHPCLGGTSFFVSVAFAGVELHWGLSDKNTASIWMLDVVSLGPLVQPALPSVCSRALPASLRDAHLYRAWVVGGEFFSFKWHVWVASGPLGWQGGLQGALSLSLALEEGLCPRFDHLVLC